MSAASKSFEIYLQNESKTNSVDESRPLFSLNSFTVMPPEDAPSDVLGGEWSPGRGWDAAREGHTHCAAAERLQMHWKQSEEAAWVT